MQQVPYCQHRIRKEAAGDTSSTNDAASENASRHHDQRGVYEVSLRKLTSKNLIMEALVSDEEPSKEEEASALFFNKIVPGLWVGLLDMVHDLWMRLGDFMEEQSAIYSDVMGEEEPESPEEHGDVIPFRKPKGD